MGFQSKAKTIISNFVVLFFLAIFPLIPGTSGFYENITKTRFHLFAIMTAAYLVVIFIFSCAESLFSNGAHVYQKRIKLSISQIVLIMYMIWSVVAAFLSKYPLKEVFIGQARYEGLLSILLYGLLFLAISIFSKHDDWFIYAMSIMVIILGSISLLQCFGLNIFYPEGFNYINTHFIGTIGHYNFFSGVVAMIVPCLFCGFVFLEDKKRFLCLPGIILLMVCQLFSDVDSGKIGLLAAFIVALPFLLSEPRYIARSLQGFGTLLFSFGFYKVINNDEKLYRIKISFEKTTILIIAVSLFIFAAGYLMEQAMRKTDRRFNKKIVMYIICIIIVIAIIAAVVLVYNYHGNKRLLMEASDFLHGHITDEMGTFRGYIWKSSLQIIKHHPLVGSGPGTFVSEFVPYNEGYHVYIPLTNVDFAHNDYLHKAVEQGVIGLVLYAVFIITLLIRGFKSAIRNNITVMYLSASVGFLVHLIFGFSIAIISPIFWVIAAMLEGTEK